MDQQDGVKKSQDSGDGWRWDGDGDAWGYRGGDVVVRVWSNVEWWAVTLFAGFMDMEMTASGIWMDSCGNSGGLKGCWCNEPLS